MHYDVCGHIIRSEYAAKTTMCPNKIVAKYICSIPSGAMVLDYGCGKLRHTILASSNDRIVIGIDSKRQLSLKQTIQGQSCTIVSYAERNLPNVKIYDLEDVRWRTSQYDRILCNNVLSAIPYVQDRYIVLENIQRQLHCDGEALISVQYRNSYFKQYHERTDIQQYQDGWIIPLKHYFTFYGIIMPADLEKMFEDVGLETISSQKKDRSVYFIVKRRNR